MEQAFKQSSLFASNFVHLDLSENPFIRNISVFVKACYVKRLDFLNAEKMNRGIVHKEI